MHIYIISLTALLLITGCVSTPDAKLAPKLSHYTTAQQQCSDFIDGKSELDGVVEKACSQFIKRLDTANATAIALDNGSLKRGERDQVKTRYAREQLKLKQQYNTLSKDVHKATLYAIEKDDTDTFSLGIAFPGNTFITPYYNYMKSKSPLFDTNQQYLDFTRHKSEKFMLKGEQYLKQGKQKSALKTFEKAANLGNPQAARSAGLLYENSDRKKAIALHNKAAKNGVKASYLNLGRLYEAEGQKESALKWYLKAADNNSSKAQYRLYKFYLKEDREKAISWLEKSSSNGYTHAQYEYALLLMKEEKTAKAIDLLRQASQNNYPQATDYLGEYYYNNQLFERAFAQLKQTESADSFYLRAKMLEQGTGTTRDYSLSYTFYTRADALGKKDVKKDIQRVDTLLSKEQQRNAAKEKKMQAKLFASMIKQCGGIPTPSTIKKRGKRFHITGTASAPVGRRSFIIYGDDGEDYYLLRAKGIQEDDKVNISIMSTGSTAAINSAEDEEAVDIYQFTFIKECVIEEEEQ